MCTRLHSIPRNRSMSAHNSIKMYLIQLISGHKLNHITKFTCFNTDTHFSQFIFFFLSSRALLIQRHFHIIIVYLFIQLILWYCLVLGDVLFFIFFVSNYKVHDICSWSCQKYYYLCKVIMIDFMKCHTQKSFNNLHIFLTVNQLNTLMYSKSHHIHNMVYVREVISNWC